ncbi:hypothetical protein [Streptomyces gobitricini]|uniref:ABM domain-containing protein n=1 Tax=Streptomyces gobitricini TaxID=68211 RepID=A0ABP5Z851_9ACTN
MPIIMVQEMPGVTQAQYEQVTDRVSGGKGGLGSRADYPVPGLISHAAGPTPDGWIVVDVWESEEALQRFSEHLLPALREAGVPEDRPKIFSAFNVITD